MHYCMNLWEFQSFNTSPENKTIPSQFETSFQRSFESNIPLITQQPHRIPFGGMVFQHFLHRWRPAPQTPSRKQGGPPGFFGGFVGWNHQHLREGKTDDRMTLCIQMPPEVWCLGCVLGGPNTEPQEVFGCLGWFILHILLETISPWKISCQNSISFLDSAYFQDIC